MASRNSGAAKKLTPEEIAELYPNLKPFPKGVSGNPSGRAKGIARRAREAVGDNGDRLILFWLDVLESEDSPMAARLEASRLLAERGFGKAASFAPVEEEDPLGLEGASDKLTERLARVLPLHDGTGESGGQTQA